MMCDNSAAALVFLASLCHGTHYMAEVFSDAAPPDGVF